MTTETKAVLDAKDFKGEVHPDWCPGCGDFGVLNCVQRALAELGLYQHQVAVISGIGCSSNLPGFINTYGMHTLHSPLTTSNSQSSYPSDISHCN